MALTRDFKETIKKRVECDPDFAKSLLHEAVDLLLDSNSATAKHGLPFTVEVPDEELDSWQRDEIKKGIEEMKAGKLIDHSDVVKRRAARQ
jgi:predicted transcriptional regulator